MSERINKIAYAVSGKSSPKECDMQDIKKLIQQYPYFAPAQFLLLQQLKEEGGNDYLVQAQKAVLYYHDPMEFEYFINARNFESELLLEEPGEDRTDSGKPGAQAVIEPVVVTEKAEKRPAEEPFKAEKDKSEEENRPEKIEEEKVQFEATPLEENNVALPSAVIIPAQANERVIEKTAVPPEEEFMPQVKISILQDNTAGGPATADDIPFEPYYTVDYFASQGIKLKTEEAPKDKLGQQLKSFTEWLKTMKRLPGGPVPAHEDALAEQNIQHMAEGSVHNPEVATEAMAEVWLKQGNSAKAAEVYQKLKLQNPAKSAYFAAKIENLKDS